MTSRQPWARWIGGAVIAAWCLAVSGPATAAPVRVLTDDTGVQPLWPAFEVTAVQPATDLPQTIAVLPDEAWQALTSPHQHFGPGGPGQARWARFKLSADGFFVQRRFLIHEQTFVDRVRLFVLSEGRWVEIPNLRDADSGWFGGARNPGFVVRLMPGQTRSFLLKTESASLLRFPLKLYDTATFLKSERRAYLLAGALIVMPLSISLFLLVLWQLQRQRPLLLAVGLILSEMVGAAWVGGVFQVMMPWLSAEMMGNIGMASWSGTLVFAFLHARHFLSLSGDAPRIDRVFRFGPVLIVPGLVMEFLNVPYSRQVLIYLGLISVLLFFVVAVWQAWRRLPFAQLYALAWGTYAASLSLIVVNLFGAIPPNLSNLAMFAQGSVAAALFALAVIGQLRAREASTQARLRDLAGEQARARALEAFRLQFENAPIGLYRARSDGFLLRANPALLRLLGCDDLDAARRRFGSTLWHDDAGRHAELMRRTQAEGQVTDFEYDGPPQADGHCPRLLENTRHAGEIAAGGFAFEGAVQDITTRYRLEQALHDANRATRQAIAERTRLFAATNHDLRQPLQTLGLLLELLLPRTADPQSRRWIEQMRAAQHNLGDTLDGLLTLSRMEAGALEPRREAVALGPLLQRLSSEYQLVADAKGLALSAMPTRRWVMTDARLLERMLRNLLANALRYTDRGRVLIGVRGFGDRVRLQVLDTGPGVAPAVQAEIFKAFRQGDADHPMTREGFGLGLAIVRGLADLVGAEVALHSVPGRGSVFELQLPAAAERSEVPQPKVEYAALPRLDGWRILVLDDESAVREALGSMLTGQGADVRLAANGAEAQACVGQHWVPQHIVLDYRLQGESGLEVLAHLRARLLRDLPAVLVTGEPPLRVPDGVTVMRKPVQADALLRQLAL